MKSQLGTLSMDFTMPSQEQLRQIVNDIEWECAEKKAPVNNKTKQYIESEAIKRVADFIVANARFNQTPINQYPGEKVEVGVGSERQQDTERPKTFNYWKIEIYLEGQDLAIVGYSKDEIPVSGYSDDYLTIFQSTSGIDIITIPLSRVIAVKSYAVTE
ncbi:hypothetical protein M5U04_17700 [Xenorhabdus sp. XENO-1]|uniref:hypothetical protein n=1 Tax=Xenorhabdus bovienii TaxID=40576 RepID=UPI0020CA6503|nr:hypothetical protein [Xenorhabdus bovienii]MCP9269863.1 hypothetical protein [Xenorhabdus bovienii subsp. africana]